MLTRSMVKAIQYQIEEVIKRNDWSHPDHYILILPKDKTKEQVISEKITPQ